jgi:hypothetical protein
VKRDVPEQNHHGFEEFRFGFDVSERDADLVQDRQRAEIEQIEGNVFVFVYRQSQKKITCEIDI